MRVVDDSLFASLDPVALRGSRCSSCGAHVFPAMGSCPVCTGVDVEDVPLPTTGTVWSWTTQRFAPKPPYRRDDSEEFAPFSIGYVDLGPVIVEGWLVGRTAWTIGEPVALVLATAWTEGDDEVRTFAFAADTTAADEAAR
ncbi:MAG: Zn-ribbon domain-containing OB-fold protein [Actinomycetes bacterium]